MAGIGNLVDKLHNFVMVESSDPAAPEDGELDDWEKWAEELFKRWKKSSEKAEAKEKPPVIKKYCKRCSLDCFQKNIRHFVHISEMEPRQAVAASYATLRRACGVGKDQPRMTPKEIVAKGGK